MKLRFLSEVIKSNPEFKPQWRADGQDVIAGNIGFGMIMHAVVCDDKDKPLYDQPLWAEPQGAIMIPKTPDGCIAMVEVFRLAPSPSPKPEYPPTDLSQHGRISLELPRGFPEKGETPEEAACREAQEELGYEVASVRQIGEHNFNTTFFVESIPVFIVELSDREIADSQPDLFERIQRVSFISPHDVLNRVASGEIFCGATKSALMAYFASKEGRAALK